MKKKLLPRPVSDISGLVVALYASAPFVIHLRLIQVLSVTDKAFI